MRTQARALLLSGVVVLLLGGAAAAHAVTRGGAPARNAVVRPLRPLLPETFAFVGGGDIALTGSADAQVFAGIRPYLRRADLAVANLEGTLATSGAPKCSGSAESGC